MDSSTYRVVSADVGNEIKVRVSFTDDLGDDEGPLTSDAVTVEYTAATPGPPGPGEVVLVGNIGQSGNSSSAGLDRGRSSPFQHFGNAPYRITAVELDIDRGTSLRGLTVKLSKLGHSEIFTFACPSIVHGANRCTAPVGPASCCNRARGFAFLPSNPAAAGTISGGFSRTVAMKMQSMWAVKSSIITGVTTVQTGFSPVTVR